MLFPKRTKFLLPNVESGYISTLFKVITLIYFFLIYFEDLFNSVLLPLCRLHVLGLCLCVDDSESKEREET